MKVLVTPVFASPDSRYVCFESWRASKFLPRRFTFGAHVKLYLDYRNGDAVHPNVLTLEESIVRFAKEKRNGQRVVFTNGCFDLLHPGHIESLQAARALGDVLIVGINSDSSVRSLKGPARPVLPEQERAEILASLECVDAVLIFPELTPQRVISLLLPDVLVKGGDWPGDRIVGREEVEAAGGKVVRIDIVPGYSTSKILEKIRSLNP
jgi:D-glycero-beta-D-manno-heptose 1-phosphate adenylyltransferase